MSARAKARVVFVALTLLTVWPAVHVFLAVRYDLSAWKLAGWGMYATPRFGPLGVEISGRADAQARWIKLASPSAQLREDAREFVARYRWLGRLIRPDTLARTALREHPQWRELRVTMVRPMLDKDTGMVVVRRQPFDYPPTP